MNPLSSTDTLPADRGNALLVGRVWLEGSHPGPALVTVNNGQVIDITAYGPTMADLLERDDLQAVVQQAEGPNLGSVEALLENSQLPQPQAPYLLAPCDVQAVKACGVTFAVSLAPTFPRLRRVLKRRCRLKKRFRRAVGGRNIWKSASAPMRRYLPKPSRSHQSVLAPRWACTRPRSGIIPSRKLSWQ